MIGICRSRLRDILMVLMEAATLSTTRILGSILKVDQSSRVGAVVEADTTDTTMGTNGMIQKKTKLEISSNSSSPVVIIIVTGSNRGVIPATHTHPTSLRISNSQCQMIETN